MSVFFRNRSFRVGVAWGLCLTMLLPPAAMSEDGLFGFLHGNAAATPVECLARQIDKLEKHVDQFGSIVIKAPDVWGESRLMRHRADIEGQLKARLGAFNFRINAVQATRDAAFLATAVALQEQIASGQVNPLTGTPATSSPSPTNVNGATGGLIPDTNTLNGTSSGAIIGRTGFSGPLAVVDGKVDTNLSVGIEPVIELDQMNRYLQHLNELRRLNEGDDNSDTPGYALNLIRIPVSILPGRRTEQGFGAEVQISIDPYMSDEILPLAFKDFVINGVVDRISYDVWQIARMSEIKKLDERLRAQLNPALKGKMRATLNNTATDNLKYLNQLLTAPETTYQGALNTYSQEIGEVPAELIDSQIMALDGTSEEEKKAAGNSQVVEELQRRLLADVNHRDLSSPASHREMINGDTLDRLAVHAYYSLVQPDIPGVDVASDHRVDHGLTMPEVSTLLGEEVKAAYEFLSQPSAVCLWSQFCTPELARKVRENRQSSNDVAPSQDSVGFSRREFFDQIKNSYVEAHGSVTEALAWQIIVESALINERLVTDMRETASLKNCPCIPTDWMQFFGPNPPPEARHAFGEYVRCKWPIHVFALDPVTQDQNVSDSFSQRREMQMAVAIAASSRMLGGQAMQRFVRRMEYDLETIQLNRTAVAFSHGDNSFGWRFYPRVQAPPVPGNLQVCVQDLLIGGQDRNKQLNTHRLEPGIRECTALVVMPSFVPQVMVDVRTDWFRLAKHVPLHRFNNRKPDHEDSMELSKQLTELRCLQAQCMNDAHKYRDGDVYRLCKAVERLEDRLPMQTHNVSVPWENDLGGFEVFQSGTQVLGPEIHGWYGAPGVKVQNTQLERNLLSSFATTQRLLNDTRTQLLVERAAGATPERLKKLTDDEAKYIADLAKISSAQTDAEKLQTSTAVFLVGKNFSVLNCRVIAGGVDVTNTIEVINRNLMQVRIPSTVSTVATGHTGAVDHNSVVVHLATPYGATSRLLIPVAGTAEASDAGLSKKAAEEAATAAKAAAASAAAAAGKAQTAADASTAISAQIPAEVTWGKVTTNPAYDVSIYYDRSATPPAFKISSIDMDPDDQMPKDILIRQTLLGTEEEDAEMLVNGKLLVTVKFAGITKAIKLPVEELTNGDITGGALTPKSLFERVIKSATVQGKLPHSPSAPVEITVVGYVKFSDKQQPTVRIKNTITYKLTVIPRTDN